MSTMSPLGRSVTVGGGGALPNVFRQQANEPVDTTVIDRKGIGLNLPIGLDPLHDRSLHHRRDMRNSPASMGCPLIARVTYPARYALNSG